MIKIVECPVEHGLGPRAGRVSSLAGTGVWQCDLRTEALTWTPEVFDIFAVPRQSRIDRRDIVLMYCDESREVMERLRADAIARQRGFSLDARICRADGELRWMRLTGGIISSQGRPTRLYGTKQDITEEREHWETLRRMTERDALTGLANRGTFQTRFLDSPGSARTITPLGALVLFDIDGFRRVNDKWGHAAGDACLKTVAERLSTGFPDALMIARVGGDRIAILVHVDRPVTVLERIVERQIAVLATPVFWQGGLIEVSVSAGIAAVDDPVAYDAEALVAAADAALHHARQAGRDTFRTADQIGRFTEIRRFART